MWWKGNIRPSVTGRIKTLLMRRGVHTAAEQQLLDTNVRHETAKPKLVKVTHSRRGPIPAHVFSVQ